MSESIIDNILNDTLFEDYELFGLQNPSHSIFTESELREFNQALSFMESLNFNDEFYLEEVSDKDTDWAKRKRKAERNTADSIKKTGEVYGAAIDIKGAEYKAGFNIIHGIAMAVATVAKGILKIFTVVFNAIKKLAMRIAHIPREIANKITGDIELYITLEDFNLLYNESVMAKLGTAMSYITALTKNSDVWKSYKFRNDDIRTLNKLHAIVINLESIEFKPTVIKMNKKENVDMYILGETKLQFNNLKGQSFSGNYFDALMILMDDLKKHSDALQELVSIYGNKYSNTQQNSNFAELSVKDQNKVTQGMRDINTIIAIVGNISKYVMHDIDAISKATDNIDKYYSKIKKNDIKQDEKKKKQEGKQSNDIDTNINKARKAAEARKAKDRARAEMNNTSDPNRFKEVNNPNGSNAKRHNGKRFGRQIHESVKEKFIKSQMASPIFESDEINEQNVYDVGKSMISFFDKYTQPVIHLTSANDKSNDGNCISGYNPYWPESKLSEFPQYNGEPMRLVIQINFSKLPALDGFPDKGILQLFAPSNEWILGELNSNDFKTVYWADTSEKGADESKIPVYRGEMDDGYYTRELPNESHPFSGDIVQVIPPFDTLDQSVVDEFYNTAFGKLNFHPDLNSDDSGMKFKIMLYKDILNEAVHSRSYFTMIGGYSYETTMVHPDQDPGSKYIQVCELDSNFGMQWDDGCTASLFVSKEGLSKKDFSDFKFIMGSAY